MKKNVLSSLNAVISTNERNRVYNKVTWLITGLIIKSYRQKRSFFDNFLCISIQLIDYRICYPGGTDCCLRLNESEHVADLVQKIARCKSLMHLINKVRLIFTHCRLSFDDGPNDFSLPPFPWVSIVRAWHYCGHY
jgi:hypothetical protein